MGAEELPSKSRSARASRRIWPPAVRVIYDNQGLPSGLLFERTGESVRVEERGVFVERG